MNDESTAMVGREKGGAKEGSDLPPAALPELSPCELRRKLTDLVLNDLRGPAGGDYEEVGGRERITDRYLVGSLAPKGAKLSIADDDDVAMGAGEEEDGEGSVTPDARGSVWMLPTSFGLSFMVEDSVTEIAVSARWGRYTREQSAIELKKDGSPALVWKRTPMGGEPQTIKLREFPASGNEDTTLATPDFAQPEVRISGRIRKRDGHWYVTLFLNNEQEEGTKHKGARWLFQAEMTVEGLNGEPVFVHHHLPDGRERTLDEREAAMLYRNQLGFAAGHGVAVHVKRDKHNPERAVRLQTASAPEYEVPRTEAPDPEQNALMRGLVLDMETLAGLERGAFGDALSPLPRAYAAWIANRRNQVSSPDLADHQETATQTLNECDDALARIEAGIRLLDENDQAAQAFRFANRAMQMQRIHTRFASDRREAENAASVSLEALDIPKNRSWRPFQLAFILSNLPSLSDLHHPDRSVDPTANADLLWFPTGGGKTEAYLGLTAYTLAIRRLQGTVAGYDGENGVAVMMRYTLRLLTLQQFQRATALICACEVIRRQDPETWGSEPFRIGLWVGKSMTPNWTSEAEKAITAAKGSGFSKGTGNPHQLTFCPWCGTTIERKGSIDVELPNKGAGRTFIYCGDKLGNCEFSRKRSPRAGLPVLVVDEEIYRNPPSLLIATVDKFAQMPWKGAVQNLFGRVDARCERHGYRAADIEDTDTHKKLANLPAAKTIDVSPLRPPDLIIQDELHLISGPLGTLVGLYETAVDALCTWEVDGRGVRPKVIASTATIRRAPQQIRDLFLRDVNIFPPNGLEASDNFFALQRPAKEDNPGRLYLGICARGTRLKAALIRVYLALLAASQTLYEEYGDRADPYMTLVGYFGALRELGGMRRLVDDDVTQRLRRMDQRGLKRRNKPRVEELTSRLNSEQVPVVLDQLSVRFDQRNAEFKRYPIDVLLATNMISVGVDVPRLGLMAIAGQPKNTAEYIQASSRVGRETRAPGLVVTVYNWTRPRDLSHYEGFEQYHGTLYQQVEPLSVTPFAPRAIDRALSSVLVSLVRLDDDTFADNKGAGRVTDHEEALVAASRIVADRAVAVTGDAGLRALVQAELDRRRVDWLDQAETTGGAELAYEARKDGTSVGLLVRPEEEDWSLFTALSSLRDVEPGVGLILKEYGMDDDLSGKTRVVGGTAEDEE